MNRVAYLFGAMAIAGFMAIPAFAQDSPSSKVTGVVQNGNRTIVFENNNAGLNLDQISAFSQVKAADPDIAAKLAKNPSLINSDGFVSKHPALQQFLAKYPDARQDIAANPGNYLTPVKGSAFQHAAPGLKD